MSQSPKVSIIVLSFNTKDLLYDCISSLQKLRGEIPFEIILVDNASVDGSPDMIKSDFPWVKLIQNDKNLGFAAGNNVAKSRVKGEFVLFLNSDTQVPKNTLIKSVEYMENHKEVGALTCKTILPSGKLDKDARRAFPTPWIALTHFTYLDRLFPHSRIFSQYWYGYVSPDKIQEIDALQGAFFLTRKKILDEVGWFDETYFLDGEDIDLSWKIRQKDLTNIYYPEVSIIHIKKASKRKGKQFKAVTTGVKSMEIFYKKHLWNRYPFFINWLVILGIRILIIARLIKRLFI